MTRSACKILNKALLSNDIFNFCVNIKYRRTISGLTIIFINMSLFLKIIDLKSQNLRKLQREKNTKNIGNLGSSCFRANPPL
jgi:hypothetical protein